MKIASYYRGLPTDTALVSLMDALGQVGQEIVPCFPLGAGTPRGERPPQPAERLRNRLPRWLWNIGQLWHDYRGTQQLFAICKAAAPDLIHERYLPFSLGGVRVARRLGLPLITIVHEFQAYQMPERFTPALRGLARHWERAAIRGADRIIVVSGVLRDAVVAQVGYPAERILVLPNGVHPAHFQGLEEARERHRAALNAAPGEALLGYLQNWEGAPLQVLAEKALCELMGHLSHLPVRLVLIGGGTQIEAVRRRMAEDSRVAGRAHFVGQVAHADVPGYLAALDAALIPAHEQFTSPLKLLEYMGAGCAVVAPDMPNIREIVSRDELALVFRPGDMKAMAQAIIQLIESPEKRRRLGENARREILSNYTWRTRAERFVALAAEVLAERRAPRRH